MDIFIIGVKNSQEKERLTSCQSPKDSDRKESKSDILLHKQGGVKSLYDKRSQIIFITVLILKKKKKNGKRSF